MDLDHHQSALQASTQRSRLPEAAVDVFKVEFYQHSNHYPKTAQKKGWAQKFDLKQEQITGWFVRERDKLKRNEKKASNSPVVYSPLEEDFELSLPQDNRALEEAAKARFSWMKDDVIVRLVTIFQNTRIRTDKGFKEVADRIGIPPEIVKEFHKWTWEREGAIHTHSASGSPMSPSMQSPTATTAFHISTAFAAAPQSSNDIKMETDEPEVVVHLPTPQQSEDRTPSPPKEHAAEPIQETSFLEFWNSRKKVAKAAQQSSSKSPISNPFQNLLSPALLSFSKSA